MITDLPSLDSTMFAALAGRTDLLMWLTDRCGRIEWANQAFANRSGLTPEKLLGQKFFSVLAPYSQVDAQQAYIREQLLKGESFKFELACRLFNHSESWLLVDGQPIYDEEGIASKYSVLATDITLRKQTEQDLEQVRLRLKRLVESAQLVPWEADIDTDQFTYIGPQAVQLLGYDLARWYEPNFWLEHIHPEDLPKIPYRNRTALLEQDDYIAEYRVFTANRQWIWVKDIVTVVRNQGHAVQVLGFLLEISDRKQAEVTLQQAKTSLEQANKELEIRVEQRTAALNQQKEKSEQALQQLQKAQTQLIQSEKMSSLGQMVAGIAHEINNPLSCIVGNLQPIELYIQDLFYLLHIYQNNSSNLTEEIQKAIENIDLEFVKKDLPRLLLSMSESTIRIQNISKSRKIFVRGDTSKKVVFNIHEGIDSTLLILQHRLKSRSDRPAIQVSKSYGEIPSIYCFPGQLNQVLMNLIVNAIDALEESNKGRDYTDIQANPNQLHITTELAPEQSSIVIRIKDNGVGMSDAVKQKALDYLFTTKSVGHGTGLGLSISRQIIEEKHGGKLTCTSVQGEGTEFTIHLSLEGT